MATLQKLRRAFVRRTVATERGMTPLNQLSGDEVYNGLLDRKTETAERLSRRMKYLQTIRSRTAGNKAHDEL